MMKTMRNETSTWIPIWKQNHIQKFEQITKNIIEQLDKEEQK